MQIIWLRRYTYWLNERLHWYSSNTDYINTPLISSYFKSALVSSLLKNLTLDNDNMKYYQPVSNLSFLSKVLEKVVASHLNFHMNSSTHQINLYIGHFILLKLPFLKSTMIGRLQHWRCLTFPLPSIPLAILFSWEDFMIGSGLPGRHLTALIHFWIDHFSLYKVYLFNKDMHTTSSIAGFFL